MVFWVSVGIVALTLGLIGFDLVNYFTDKWDTQPRLRTIAILRLGLLVSLGLFLWPQRNRDWKSKVSPKDKLLCWILIGYILAWCVVTSVIGSTIHGQVVIFVIAVLTGGTVLIIRPAEAFWVFGISLAALFIGMMYFVPILPHTTGNLIGAATVTVVAFFVSIFNYRRTANSYNDRQTIIQQQKKLETLNADIAALLKEREQELSDFVYASSHDLRAPVVEMKGLWEIFIAEEGLSEMHQAYIEVARGHTRSLDAYTRNLIGVMESRRQDIKFEKIDPVGIINDCISQLIFLEDEVRPRFEIAPETSDEIHGDRYRLWLMLTILLENAVRFQRKDEENLKVLIRMFEQGEKLHVEVEDNGQGMSQAFLKDIWKRFSRGTKGKVGAGLGLFVAKEVVESLQGEFEIKSEEGKGTHVYLRMKCVTSS